MSVFFRNHGWLLLFTCLQVAFWSGYSVHAPGLRETLTWRGTRAILPDMTIVPEVPGAVTVKALSFGDEEFYFRLLALDIQNAGDSYGRFTELYKYDYKKLSSWFTLLDTLDSDSNYVPFLASYYYGQTQHVSDVRYVIDYLYDHSHARPGLKYWWLSQAAYLAEHKLKDSDLALKMALPLEQAHDAPFWVRQLPAFVHERRGEMGDARHIIEDIEANTKDIPPSELRFMRYFVEERTKKLEMLEKDKKSVTQ